MLRKIAATAAALLAVAPTEIAACSSCNDIRGGGGGENGAIGGAAGMYGGGGGGVEDEGVGSSGEGAATAATTFDTVVMVDAGSSGCRLNVYRLDGEVCVGSIQLGGRAVFDGVVWGGAGGVAVAVVVWRW